MKCLIKEYLFVAAGAFLVSVGVNMFLVPLNISTGGVSGIGTILYHTVKLPLWVTTVAVNAVLFVFGYRTLERSALVKTAFGIGFLTFFLAVTQNISAFTDDIIISSVFGGSIAGFGVGLTVKKGASTGGSDFAAMMLHKLVPHISVANFILLIDIAIIAVSGTIFRDYTLMFYSVIALFIASKVTDYVIVSGNFAKCLYIISEKHDEISEYVMGDISRGVTGINIKGLYTKKEGMMLMCVVGNKEVPKIISAVKAIDKNAFTVINDIREVHGEGFIRNV